MSQSEIDQGLRANIYWGASLSTGLLGLTALLTRHFDAAIIALSFSVFMVVIVKLQTNNASSRYLEAASFLLITFLAIVTLSSAFLPGALAEYWSYIFPVILFFILPVKYALVTVGIYTAIFLIVTTNFYAGPSKPQLLISYFFCLLLACAFAYLREERDKQLKPLRKTDNLTLASTLEHLETDLNREIQRSEREGSSLCLIALSVDDSTLQHGTSARIPIEKAHLLRVLGRILHENLRPFDSYYRYHDDQFLIILPHTGTPEAIRKGESLRMRCKKHLNPHGENITVSVGVTGLNVGDDATSLRKNALAALAHANKKGGNRTQSFLSDAEPGEPALHGFTPEGHLP